MTTVWLDGCLVKEETARLAPSDRGFTLADGVFETIRAVGTLPLWWPDHLLRLKAGAACLGIDLPYEDKIIEDAMSSLLLAEGHQEAAIRVTLSRGPAKRRGLWPPGDARPTLLVSVAPSPLARSLQTVVIARSTRRNELSPLSRIKSLAYSDNIIARREALERGAGDALLLNTRGNLACATVGNIFLRFGGNWLTPPLTDGALAGIARSRLISFLGAREEMIVAASIERADAGLISNSLGWSSIVRLDERELPPADEVLDLAPLYSC
ncbi:aminotransferase class IV [Bradyrhizobium sp. 149]|nr:aminotransferase class IV [Bradyrhizobium sp. 149]